MINPQPAAETQGFREHLQLRYPYRFGISHQLYAVLASTTAWVSGLKLPQTPSVNPKTQTLNPKPQTLHPVASILCLLNRQELRAPCSVVPLCWGTVLKIPEVISWPYEQYIQGTSSGYISGGTTLNNSRTGPFALNPTPRSSEP